VHAGGPLRVRLLRRLGRTRAAKRIRRFAPDLAKIASRVMAQVRSKPGQRLEEIGRAPRTDTGVLKRSIANLLAAKMLRTKGQLLSRSSEKAPTDHARDLARACPGK
jgi:hypothetical protein